MTANEYLVPINWHVTFFPSPLLQVCDPECVTRVHVERSVDGITGVVGAVQNECHQDEDGHKDHHPVALLSLQSEQKSWIINGQVCLFSSTFQHLLKS